MRGCRSRNGSGNPGWFRGRVHPGPLQMPGFPGPFRAAETLAVGGRERKRDREKPQKGPVWRGFLRLSLCAFGVLPVPLGFGASGRFLVYMKMYFRMKSSARTYIMGLIFLALPVTALTAT